MVFSLFFFFFFWDEHFYRLWFCTITFQMSGHQCSQVPVASHSFRFCYLFILKYSWEMWEFYQGSQKSWVNVRHCWSFKKKIKKIKSHGKYLTIYYVFGYRLFCWKMKKKKYIYIYIYFNYYSSIKSQFIDMFALFMGHEQCNRHWT